MAKFYVIVGENDEVLGCETSATIAKKEAREMTPSFKIDCVEVDSTKLREAVRLLLGNQGGYAVETTEVYMSMPYAKARGRKKLEADK